MTDYLPAHGRIIFVESEGYDPIPAIRGPLATFDDVYAAIDACTDLSENDAGFERVIMVAAVCEDITDQIAIEYARREIADCGEDARLPAWAEHGASDFFDEYMAEMRRDARQTAAHYRSLAPNNGRYF